MKKIHHNIFVFFLLMLFIPLEIFSRNSFSLALDKKGNFLFLTHTHGILYKIDPKGNLINTFFSVKKGNREISLTNINCLYSDSFGNIYAFNTEAIEILKLNEDLNIEKNIFINFNIQSLPNMTIGANDRIFIRLPETGFFEYSPQGDIISQLLKDDECKDITSIGARGKMAVYDRKKVLLWYNNQDISQVFNINMETGACKKENFGSYINFLTFDKKGRTIILAPSWIQVVDFFSIKGNSDIYPNSLSPGTIAIDNLNNYYIYNIDYNEILCIKDTGKIDRILKLDNIMKLIK